VEGNLLRTGSAGTMENSSWMGDLTQTGVLMNSGIRVGVGIQWALEAPQLFSKSASLKEMRSLALKFVFAHLWFSKIYKHVKKHNKKNLHVSDPLVGHSFVFFVKIYYSQYTP